MNGVLPAEVRRPAASARVWLMRTALIVAAFIAIPTHAASLRFYGNGVNDIDRVKIRIDAPAVPADVGATDFTIEFWMKALDAENSAGSGCSNTSEGWINGNVIIDRDQFGAADYGKYGISLFSGGLGFGVNMMGNGRLGAGLCGSRNVADGQWHHVAATYERSSGQIRLFVDGVPDGSADTSGGDVSYRDGRSTSWANDPFIVIGAEKHDADNSRYPSYSGFIDELRLSTTIRYSGTFSPPAQAFTIDGSTAALYHFDEGSGNVINDTSAAAGGPSNGVRRYGTGGSRPAGPEWSSDSPFGSAPSAGTLRFSTATYSVAEGSVATVTVTRTGGSSGSVSVDFASTSGGSAIAGADYTATSGVLNWADGDSTSKSFAVSTTNDPNVEGNETVNVAISSPTGGASLGSPSSAVLTIVDDDAPSTIRFSSASFSGNEDVGTVVVNVQRSGNSSGAVSVNYATSNGSAMAGADFTTASGVLNWADGDSATKSFSVPIINDTGVEGDETVNLAISNPTGGAVLGSPTSAVLTIVDDDSPSAIRFSSASFSVNENGSAAVISVMRSGNSSGAVSVNYSTANGSASAGSDYIYTSGTLNWSDGQSGSRTFAVPIINDADVEGNETINLTLSNPSGATLGSPNAAVLTISDAGGNSDIDSEPAKSMNGPTGCTLASGESPFDPILWLPIAVAAYRNWRRRDVSPLASRS